MKRYHSTVMDDESSAKKTTGVDWGRVQTVLLDMDGTLLDLAYDNHFWTEHLPARYAELQGISLQASNDFLGPIFESTHGTLDWYCIDYWTERLQVDISALKRETAERVGWLDGAQVFLRSLEVRGLPRWLVTNAHPKSLSLKVERTGLDRFLDAQFSTHSFGFPKEDENFWSRFSLDTGLDLGACLLIDDNLRVLETAGACGVGQCVAITRPDSRHPERELDIPWPSVSQLTDLVDCSAQGDI